MIPIPSEERTLHPRRFRGVPRLYDLTRSEPYLHQDEQRKLSEQQRFMNAPHNMVHRGLSHEPPLLDETRRRLRHVEPPHPHEHHEGKRNPHRVPPIPEPVQRSIFPPGGLAERPEMVRAASCMESYSKPETHFILGHISQCDAIADSKPGRKIFPHAHERSTKGDLSLQTSGVKRVPLPVRNPADDYVSGFRGMGKQSEANPPKTGMRLQSSAAPWDPLHIFETYGRRHPPIPGL